MRRTRRSDRSREHEGYARKYNPLTRITAAAGSLIPLTAGAAITALSGIAWLVTGASMAGCAIRNQDWLEGYCGVVVGPLTEVSHCLSSKGTDLMAGAVSNIKHYSL